MALFPTQQTLTQGSLHYRLATLGYQNATPTALTWLFHKMIDIYTQINKWQVAPKRYNTYGVVPHTTNANPG